jgi:sugar lactone lactonase YvrE
MLRRTQLGVSLAVLVAIAALGTLSPGGPQDQGHVEAVSARTRVFPEIGPGVTALKRDSAGRYYVLAAPASVIAIYGPDGKRIGRIPNANSRGTKITYAQDIDLDPSGRIFVADRGANSVKIFDPDGSLAAVVSVVGPTSLAALSDDEFAVASLPSDRLVSIFQFNGKLTRSFGELSDAPQSPDGGQSLNRGRIYGDSAGHIYFAFAAAPAIRKYDRNGFALSETSIPSSWFTASEESRPFNRITIEKNGPPPSSKPLIAALGIDPETQRVWAAIGEELIEFDQDGNRRASYRTRTADGVRIEPSAILVEHNRILVAADPLGVFDFARPDK